MPDFCTTQILDVIPDPALIADTDRRIVALNEELLSMFGFEREDLLGESIDVLVPHEGRARHHDLTGAYLRDPERRKLGKGVQLAGLRKDGRTIPIDIALNPVLVDGQDFVVASVRDLSLQHEAKRMLVEGRKAAEEASSAKSSFLANMSHEIRTPMHGVLGMLELLMDSELNLDQRNAVEVAMTSGRSLLGLLNDILDVSKIEAGHLELAPVPFKLSSMITSATRIMAVPAAARNNELSIEEGPWYPKLVMGDPDRLRQVLTNLIGNAVKFTEGGTIVVSVTASRSEEGGDSCELTFSVSDTGLGIPSDRIEAIFQEFTQVDASTTRKYGGTGLGLTICQNLVDMMGGRIQVESEVGRGSVFSFTVSLPIVDATQDTGDQRLASGRSLDGSRLLIVDDNEIARRVARSTLEGAGAEVEEADGADSGIAELLRALEEGKPFDAAVIDGLMPEKDGLILAKEIRAHPAVSGIRLLMLTSAAQDYGPSQAQEAGIQGYLTKPVTRADLIVATQLLLGLRGPDEGEERRMVTISSLEDAVTVSRVLLVEDNLVNQQIAAGILRKRGHSVDIANNGIEAIEQVKKSDYTTVLMDLEMPEMGGVEATEKIRQMEGRKDLPIIALTAHVLPEERERCSDAGMTGFLTKPFEAMDLLKVIEGWAD